MTVMDDPTAELESLVRQVRSEILASLPPPHERPLPHRPVELAMALEELRRG